MSATRLIHLRPTALVSLASNATTGGRSKYAMLNYTPMAGYKKRQTTEHIREPNIDEYDKMPGDNFQTVYKGFYDDERHTDPNAIDRFYRLNWGGWIRRRGAARDWQKTGGQRWWAKQHIFCSEAQSKQLEQMFAQKYRRKTYFVDDPYEIYEKRNHEFLPYGSKPYSYSYVKAHDYEDQL